MNKKTVLYVIDSLGRGGAETLLAGILPELNERYNIILVTLSDLCEFKEEEIVCSHRYSLGFKGKWSFLSSILLLRKIIRRHRPHLVHAHLVNSSIIARLACPANIPVACSLHSLLSKNVYNGSRIYRTIEKKIFNKKHFIIAVSEDVLQDYENSIARPKRSFVLRNYAADAFLRNGRIKKDFVPYGTLRLAAVGNIKKVKNYEYLLHSFILLKKFDISLDVYGKGDAGYVKSLQDTIDKNNLPVKLMGPCDHIAEILPAYDLFVMASLHEGFGMAAIEAMGLGLPAVLSNLKVLREVTFNNAIFFDLDDPASLATILKSICQGQVNLKKYSAAGIAMVNENYSKTIYLKKINEIYDEILGNTRR